MRFVCCDSTILIKHLHALIRLRKLYCNVRFQFSLKTLEAECIGSNINRRGNFIPLWCQVPSKQYHDKEFLRQLLLPSVQQILNWTENGRSIAVIWEPLLPVASISDSGNDAVNQRYRKETLSILREEIQFQFRRSMKQYLGADGKRARHANGNAIINITFDELFSNLKEYANSLPDDYSSRLSNVDKTEKASQEEKQEFILDILFQSPPFHNLVRKLFKKFQNLAEDTYSNFRSELRKCSNRLAMVEQKQRQRHNMLHFGGGKKRTIKNGRDNTTPKISFLDDIENHDVQQAMVSFGGISLRINEFHLNKMKELFELNLRTARLENELDEFFPSVLFTTLLRYDALEGAGLQSAIPSSVFCFLNKKYGCDWECFASPFNCWLEKNSLEDEEEEIRESLRGGKFGCAFGDTDAWFGGSGSFFGTDFLQLAREGSGCFQANPPFSSNFIASMSERMDEILTESNKYDNRIPLMFIVFVPAWKESSGWNTLMKSTFLSKHILLSQKQDAHYYAEGTQHRRRGVLNSTYVENIQKGTTYRIASFDTSVFFFQNDAGKRKWLINCDDEKLLKSAFSMQRYTMSESIDKKNPIKDLPTKKEATQKGRKGIQKKNKKENVVEESSSSTKKKAKLVSAENDELGILSSLHLPRDGPTQSSKRRLDKDNKASGKKKQHLRKKGK